MPNPAKRARKRKKSSGIIPALIVLCIAAICVLSFSLVRTLKEETAKNTNGGNGNLVFTASAGSTAAPLILQATAIPEHSATKSPEEVSAVATPKPDQGSGNAQVPSAVNRYAPTPLPQEGYGTIYDVSLRTMDDAPMIAIMITGCSKAERMNQIIEIGQKYGARFTLFPVGNALLNPGMANAFRQTVVQLGWEIEGCAFSKKKEYLMSGGELELEMWKQGIAVSYALQGDYKEHFYFPCSNNATSDLRTHYYAQKLGYKGVCGYTYSYINNYNEGALAATLKNGNIYQFDMTDKAWGVLKSFIDSVNEKGYKVVTMNTLFGFEPNELSEVCTIETQELPVIEEYDEPLYDLKLNDHCYAVVALQNRLIELNYLQPEAKTVISESGIARTEIVNPKADGIYGSTTSVAISEFQAKAGLPATGNADIETQKALFAINAPMGTVRKSE